jgi:hypothetical protein
MRDGAFDMPTPAWCWAGLSKTLTRRLLRESAHAHAPFHQRKPEWPLPPTELGAT